jgi:eukaryotic-like serine/threonine-protein kinase
MAMSPPPSAADRWREVESLFYAAMDRPPEERVAFLDSACEGRPELRLEIEGLLKADAHTGAFIARVVEGAAESIHASQALQPGDRLGLYRILGEIGSGGMGAVYLAERNDGEFRRQVAIKVVKRGMDTAAILNRFRDERQILADLNHPNIARLLDGGTTMDGRPYLVMEYVDGLPITRYALLQKLSIPERLRLFQQVCAAVDHAHRNLVIHRDIKPGNILVAPNGVPRLLDFGIAKIVDPALPGAAETRSIGLRLLTPEYASPEQIRGEKISITTDVYSLGATLYELLTGERPRQLQTNTSAELERIVCFEGVSKPSAVAKRSGNPDARRLEGDLDNIVLMALRHDPERRYRSVEQFSEDVRRYLERLPVIARADSLLYRSGKFVRRHYWGVAGAALVAASLIGSSIIAGVHARRAEEEAIKANRRFQQVRQLAGVFIFDFERRIRTLPGATEAREFVVQTASEYLDSLAAEATGTLDLQIELAGAYERLAEIRGSPNKAAMGDRSQALALYEKSLALRRRVFLARPNERTAAMGIVRTLLDKCAIFGEQGNVSAGIQSCTEAKEFTGRFVSVPLKDAVETDIVYRVHMELGDMYVRQRNTRAGLSEYQSMLSIAADALARGPSAATERAVAAAETRVGDAYNVLGEYERAFEHQRRSIDLYRKLSEEQPYNVPLRRSLMLAKMSAGDALGRPFNSQLGDLASALKYYMPARKTAEELSTADPKNATAVVDLVSLLRREGLCYQSSGPTRGIPLLRRAVFLSGAIAERTPDNRLFQQQHAFARSNLAILLAGAGDLKSAMRERGKVVALFQGLRKRVPDSMRYFLDLQQSKTNLAKLAARAGNVKEGERLLREVLGSCSNPPAPWKGAEAIRGQHAESQETLARMLLAQGTAAPSSCRELGVAAGLWGGLARDYPASSEYRSSHSGLRDVLTWRCR